MLVAVPLFGQDVAPRFGFADSFLIAEIEDRQLVRTDQVATVADGWANRLGELRDLEVEVLLCGGFNRAFVPLAEDLGISILAGLAGNARQIVEAFARGEAMPNLFCDGMAHRRRKGQGCGPNGGQRRRRGRNSHPR